MSISEILGTIHDGDGQLCATAHVEYDRAADKETVVPGAFTRQVPATDDGAQPPQPWLSSGERASESLPRDEAHEFVKDVFLSWLKKVRASAPVNLPLPP